MIARALESLQPAVASRYIEEGRQLVAAADRHLNAPLMPRQQSFEKTNSGGIVRDDKRLMTVQNADNFGDIVFTVNDGANDPQAVSVSSPSINLPGGGAGTSSETVGKAVGAESRFGLLDVPYFFMLKVLSVGQVLEWMMLDSLRQTDEVPYMHS